MNKKIIATCLIVASLFTGFLGFAQKTFAAENVSNNGVTFYYNGSTIFASANTTVSDDYQYHYDCIINEVTVEDESGKIRTISENDIDYTTSTVKVNGNLETVERVPVPIDTNRHVIATISGLGNNEKIINVSAVANKEKCTFNNQRSNCEEIRCIYCKKNYKTEALHDWEWVVDEKATCTRAGKQHQKCKICGAVQNENTEIKALGHDWQNATETINRGIKEKATYTKNAIYYKACSRCSAKDDNQYNEVSGTRKICRHELYPDREDSYYVWVVDKAATKTKNGLKHQECRICGNVRNENTVIPKGTKSNVPSNSLFRSNSIYSNGNNNKGSNNVTNANSSKTKSPKSDNALIIGSKNGASKAIAQAQKEENPFIPMWGIIVIAILIAIAGVLAFWEFFFKEFLLSRKSKEKIEEYDEIEVNKDE